MEKRYPAPSMFAKAKNYVSTGWMGIAVPMKLLMKSMIMTMS